MKVKKEKVQRSTLASQSLRTKTLAEEVYTLYMYYAYPCPYCRRLFYTYNSSKEQASRVLYEGIKKHLIEYREDEREYEFDDGEKEESNDIYYSVTDLPEPPSGGYEL